MVSTNALNRDRSLSKFVCFYIILSCLNSMLQIVFNIENNALLIERTVSQGLLLFFLLNSCRRFSVYDYKVFISFELFICGLLAYSIFLGSSISVIASWIFSMVAVCTPLGISVYLIKDKSILYNYLIKYSWLCLLLLCINFFGESDLLYDMHFSYSIVFLSLLHINEGLRTKKYFYFIVASFEIILMLLFGSKGSILCLLGFLWFKYLYTEYSNLNQFFKRIFKLTILLSCLLAFYQLALVYSGTILNILNRFGIYSRTIYTLLSTDMLDATSSRAYIWSGTIELIKQKPILGWGIGGAIEYIGMYGLYNESYPHNIILDIFLTFGLPLGCAMILALLYLFILSCFRSSSVEKQLCCVFCAMAYFPLLVSYTFVVHEFFYMSIGLMLSTTRSKQEIN